MKAKPKRWTPAELALLGSDTDAAVAKQIGRSAGTVQAIRFSRGIPPHRGHKRIREWGPTEIVLFEQYDDLEISKMTRRSLKSVTAKRAELRK